MEAEGVVERGLWTVPLVEGVGAAAERSLARRSMELLSSSSGELEAEEDEDEEEESALREVELKLRSATRLLEDEEAVRRLALMSDVEAFIVGLSMFGRW